MLPPFVHFPREPIIVHVEHKFWWKTEENEQNKQNFQTELSEKVFSSHIITTCLMGSGTHHYI